MPPGQFVVYQSFAFQKPKRFQPDETGRLAEILVGKTDKIEAILDILDRLNKADARDKVGRQLVEKIEVYAVRTLVWC